MGKHTEHLNTLRERRHILQNSYNQKMALFGGQMNDVYRNYNVQMHEHDLHSIDREIAAAERLSDQERIQEITDGVLKNLAKDGNKAAQSIAADLQKALKSIKL